MHVMSWEMFGCPFWMTIYDRPIKRHNSSKNYRAAESGPCHDSGSIPYRFVHCHQAVDICRHSICCQNFFFNTHNPQSEWMAQSYCFRPLWKSTTWARYPELSDNPLTNKLLNCFVDQFYQLSMQTFSVDILLGECSWASLTVLFCFSLFALDLSSSFWLLALSFYLQVKGSLTLARLV